MNVGTLIEVLEYILEAVDEYEVIRKYQQLTASLNQVRENPTAELTDQLQTHKEEVISMNEGIEPTNWRYSKTKLLSIYNKHGLIGFSAIERINNAFQDNQANPAGVAQEIQEMIQELNELKQQFDVIHQTLEPVIEEYEPEEIPEGKTVLYLYFENQVEIQTIKQLEKASSEWNKIIKSFARLAQDTTETPKVYSVDKGSLILGLLAGVATIVGIAKGVSEILEVYKKVLEIRKLQLETKNLKIGGDVDKNFEERIDAIIQESADKAVEKLMAEFSDEASDKNEVSNAVSISLKKIFNFVENGGRIDYEETETETRQSKGARKKLNKAFDKIKEIESKIVEIRAQLTAKNE